jgi:putative FmdB family regulatory protein
MPTYEYECKSCHHKFEAFQNIKDEPLKKCPKCGKSLRRLFGGGMGIIFKGSGFYTTDYKHSSAVTSGNGSSKGEKKTENKPSTEKSESTTKK